MAQDAAATAQRPLTNLQLLRAKPDFARIWVGNVVSRVGDALDSLAFMWVVLQLTGSTLVMGTLMVVNMIPSIALGPFAGVLVDRWPRRRVMVGGDIGRGILTLVLAYLWATGRLTVWMLYAGAFIASVFEVFAETARRASVPLLVENRNLVVAQSLSSLGYSLAQLFGYAGAGVVLARYGVTAAILIDSATFWFSATMVLGARIPQASASGKRITLESFWADFREGLVFVRQERIVFYCLVLAALTNFALAPLNVLLPVHLTRGLKLGPDSLGQTFAVLTVGTLLGAGAVGSVARGLGELRLMRIGLLGLGASYALLYLAAGQWTVTGVLFAMGLSVPAATAGFSALMQRLTPADKLGRLGALSSALALSAMPLSAAAAGFLGEHLAIPVLFGALGLFVIGVAAVILWGTEVRLAAPTARGGEVASTGGSVLPPG